MTAYGIIEGDNDNTDHLVLNKDLSKILVYPALSHAEQKAKDLTRKCGRPCRPIVLTINIWPQKG